MVRVTSEKYRSLVVSDVGVRFVEGEAQVEDPAALDRLRGLSNLGVVVHDEPKKTPAKRSTSKQKSE